MSQADEWKDPWKEPGILGYVAVCLVALMVIGLVMFQRTTWGLALLPVLVGLGGGTTALGPVLLALALALSLNYLPYPDTQSTRMLVLDWLLCAALLGYVVAHYRLQALLGSVFPLDPRRREPLAAGRWLFIFPRRSRVIRERRAPRLVLPAEIQLLVVGLTLWAALAQVAWYAAPQERGNPGLLPAAWHAVVLAWLIGLTWLIAAGLMDYGQRRQMTREEATLFLQDVLWAETRREQRRLNRWLAWARLRRERRGGKS
jgi:hypothetical protein